MKLTINAPIWTNWHGVEISTVEKRWDTETGGLWLVETADGRSVQLHANEILVQS
jgi:hypothetical protein